MAPLIQILDNYRHNQATIVPVRALKQKPTGVIRKKRPYEGAACWAAPGPEDLMKGDSRTD